MVLLSMIAQRETREWYIAIVLLGYVWHVHARTYIHYCIHNLYVLKIDITQFMVFFICIAVLHV